jgi:hypothetical protein
MLSDMLKKTLSKHFSNGFRKSSPIELSRFRRFFAEDFNEKLNLPNASLDAEILAFGTLFEEKVYFVGIEVEERIKREVDTAISNKMGVIFYDAFYARHEDWLFPASIVSEKMLKNILVRLYPHFTHKANYLSRNNYGESEVLKIKGEILRVWGSSVLLNYEQLSERLPYIPVGKIKNALTQNYDFIWNSEGVYTNVGKVEIADGERGAIINHVTATCHENGYASLSDIPLEEIAERNYGLSPTAIHNAVFAIVLADQYVRRGKIITRKGDALDALTIMKGYCRSLEKCTLQDLLDFERKLTGESHRWIPMEAGYAVMVRVEENHYVSEKYVHFEPNEIDSALEKFITGDYLPLRSVTTFAAFPDCGQTWNLYLLESYCRRFSGRFRFEVLAVNSKKAGAIVRKDCTLSYLEIMSDAVSKSSVSLEKTAIEDFLCVSGYLGRRSYSKVNELIKLAKALRERRD